MEKELINPIPTKVQYLLTNDYSKEQLCYGYGRMDISDVKYSYGVCKCYIEYEPYGYVTYDTFKFVPQTSV